MGAFDILFSDSRRSMMPMVRRQQQRGLGPIGMLGLAGVGYAVYRFLKTDRGQMVKSAVAEQVRAFGEPVASKATRRSEAQL